MKNENELEIKMDSGINLAVARRVKVTKRGDIFEYLNFFLKNQQYLSVTAGGLVGKFSFPYWHIVTLM